MARARNRQPAPMETVTLGAGEGARTYSFQEWHALGFLKYAGLVGQILKQFTSVSSRQGVSLTKLPWRIPVMDAEGNPVLIDKIHPEFNEVQDPRSPTGVRQEKNPLAVQVVVDAAGNPVQIPDMTLNLDLISQMLVVVMEVSEKNATALCKALDDAAIAPDDNPSASYAVEFEELVLGDLMTVIQAVIKANFHEGGSLMGFLKKMGMGQKASAQSSPSKTGLPTPQTPPQIASPSLPQVGAPISPVSPPPI